MHSPSWPICTRLTTHGGGRHHGHLAHPRAQDNQVTATVQAMRTPTTLAKLAPLALLALLEPTVQATRGFLQAQGPVLGFNNTQNANFGASSCLNKDGSILAVGVPHYPDTKGEGTSTFACMMDA